MIELYVGLDIACLRHPRPAAPWLAPMGMAAGAALCLGLALGSARRIWRPSVRVWLSSALARPFLIGPTKGLASWAEAQALGRSAALSGTGFAKECVVRVEAWPGEERVLATAVERDTLETIVGAVRAKGGRLVSLRPAWAAPLSGAIERSKKNVVVAFEDGDGVTFLAEHHDELKLAMTVQPRPSQDRVIALLSRVALSHEIELSSLVWHRFWPEYFHSSNFGWQAIGNEARVA